MSHDSSHSFDDASNSTWGTYGGKTKRQSSARKKKKGGWERPDSSGDRSGLTFSGEFLESSSGTFALVNKPSAKSDVALTNGQYLDLLRKNTRSQGKYYLITFFLVAVEFGLFLVFDFSLLIVLIIVTLVLGITISVGLNNTPLDISIQNALKKAYKEDFVNYILKSDYSAQKIDPTPEILPSFLPSMIHHDKDKLLLGGASAAKTKVDSKIVMQHALNIGVPIQLLQYEFYFKCANDFNEQTQNYQYNEYTINSCVIAVLPLKTAFKTYLRVAQFSSPLMPNIANYRVQKKIFPPVFDNEMYNSNFIMDEFREKTYDTCASPDEKADLIARFSDIESSYRSSMTCMPKCKDPQNLFIKSDSFVQVLTEASSESKAIIQILFIENCAYIVFDLGSEGLNPRTSDQKNTKLTEQDILWRTRKELDNIVPFCKKIAAVLDLLPGN